MSALLPARTVPYWRSAGPRESSNGPMTSSTYRGSVRVAGTAVDPTSRSNWGGRFCGVTTTAESPMTTTPHHPGRVSRASSVHTTWIPGSLNAVGAQASLRHIGTTRSSGGEASTQPVWSALVPTRCVRAQCRRFAAPSRRTGTGSVWRAGRRSGTGWRRLRPQNSTGRNSAMSGRLSMQRVRREKPGPDHPRPPSRRPQGAPARIGRHRPRISADPGAWSNQAPTAANSVEPRGPDGASITAAGLNPLTIM